MIWCQHAEPAGVCRSSVLGGQTRKHNWSLGSSNVDQHGAMEVLKFEIDFALQATQSASNERVQQLGDLIAAYVEGATALLARLHYPLPFLSLESGCSRPARLATLA